MAKIAIRDLYGDSLLAPSEGERLREQIAGFLRDGEQVELSFANVRVAVSVFLNVAVGSLFAEFSAEQIESSLHFCDVTPGLSLNLNIAMASASRYHNDPEFRAAVEETTLQLVVA